MKLKIKKLNNKMTTYDIKSELDNFLSKCKTRNTHYSFVSLDPTGKYCISNAQKYEFWKLYNIELNKGKIYTMAEKPQPILPILGDIDLKFKDIRFDKHIKLYNDNHIKQIVKIYQDVIKNVVANYTEDNLICVVLERPVYQTDDGKYVKNGFHLHFPYSYMNNEEQEGYIIPRIIKKVEELGIFNDMKYKPESSIIDKSCCRNHWLVYGCSKKTTLPPYMISKIYDKDMKIISEKEAFKNKKLYDDDDEEIEITDYKEHIPKFMSIIPNEDCDIMKINKNIEKIEMKKEKKETKKRKETKVCKKNIEENIKLLSELLPLLSINRAKEHRDWVKIGIVIYIETDGDERGLDLWKDFSKRCPDKYDEYVCDRTWNTFTNRYTMTIATIRFYVSIDNPEGYKKYKEEKTMDIVRQSVAGSGSHNDIAKIMFSLYDDEFVCASITGNLWYRFVGHIWERDDDGVSLRKKISTDIVPRYTEMIKKMYTDLNVEDDKPKTSMLQQSIKFVQKKIMELKSYPYKKNCMSEAKDLFYNRKFVEKLDTNPYLIAFQNGVYDLKERVLRPGLPEDYLSKCLPINYKEFSEDDKGVKDVKIFLEKIFPDKSVRTYFLDTTSDVFIGGNFQKTVNVYNGIGDNGKSVTQTVIERLLGPFAVKLNTTVITGNKVSSGSSNADLSRTGGGIRMCTCEEPNGSEMINDGILNNLSGNDSFYARDLFEKGKDVREIVPLFKLILICNKLPRLRYNLKATWNRLRVIPFESVFVRENDPEGYPETYEEQLKEKRFPMDKDFYQKIPDMLEPFAWYLLEHNKNIKVRIEPEKVRSATLQYQKQNDVYREFYEEHIIKDSECNLSLSDLYATFKTWYREAIPSQTVPIRREVEEYFTNIWGGPNTNKIWKGYKIKSIVDDIDAGLAHEIPILAVGGTE